MQFSGKNAFLVLRHDPELNRGIVSIVPEGHDALAIWDASTRISPLFGIVRQEYKSPESFDFSDNWHLVFLGPVHPENVPSLASSECHVWLTLGLFNIVLVTADSGRADEVVEWAKTAKVPFESWTIEAGYISRTSIWEAPLAEDKWRETLTTVWKSSFADELKEAVQEYCPLMASTISRSAGLPIDLISELIHYNENVSALLSEFRNTPGNQAFRGLGQFLGINAGLSRFSSQTFAGTSPIAGTECHFWLHSLLGIGLASIALRSIRTFIEVSLGEARLNQRFVALRRRENDIDLAKDFPPDDDYLGAVEVESRDEIVPLLAYFSARDGYRATEWTVSAPLAAVFACNSQRWSLLTLTHEFCHVVIRAIQAELYPDFNNLDDLNRCVELIEAKAPADNTFDEIRRTMLFSIVLMDNVANGRRAGESVDVNMHSLQELLQCWRQDVDEILVHVFDFMYFYGQDVEKYVSGIWASWGVIPNISTRVLEYVVRTICAVLTKHLRRRDAEATARDQVLAALEQLKAHKGGGTYVDQALDYMTNKWEQVVLPRVRARRLLVKIVNAYLFSEKIATAVRGESELSGGARAKDKEGYELIKGDLELRRVTNPLHFVETYTDTLAPNSTQSAWMLYVLAFCCSYDG